MSGVNRQEPRLRSGVSAEPDYAFLSTLAGPQQPYVVGE